MRMIYKYVIVTIVFALTRNVSGGSITLKVDPTKPAPVRGVTPKVTGPPIGNNISICYKYVGCFDNYFPFNNTGGELPNPPQLVGTAMLLYTPNNKDRGHWIDYKDKGKSLDTSQFNKNYPVKFIIHGFTQDETEEWLHQMKDALFTLGPVNTIIVGWGPGSSMPDYPQAVANTRLVARQIQLVIKEMVKRGMELSRIHLIGHSLGAHISGYVGHSFGGQIGRISGMDPAAPLFESTGEEVRLHKGDALFVDVIHSNGAPLYEGGAGMFGPCGDVDFYPNGGQHQPGCPGLISGTLNSLLSLKASEIGSVATCSHSRSHYLFMESILSEGCKFVANPCKNWDTFTSGKCRSCGSHGCTELGYHSIEYAARGSFFLATKGSEKSMALDGDHFCGATYDITLTTKSKSYVKGAIKLKLVGTRSETVTDFQGSSDQLKPATKIVVVDFTDLGDIVAIDVTYTQYEGFWGFGAGDDKWTLDSVTVSHNGKTIRFCSSNTITVKSGAQTRISKCK